MQSYTHPNAVYYMWLFWYDICCREDIFNIWDSLGQITKKIQMHPLHLVGPTAETKCRLGKVLYQAFHRRKFRSTCVRRKILQASDGLFFLIWSIHYDLLIPKQHQQSQKIVGAFWYTWLFAPFEGYFGKNILKNIHR